MEEIAQDDDLLSDILLDSLEFEPKIATHKMNQAYRSPRYKTQQIIDIVRHKVVVEADLQGALDALCSIDVIKKHMASKSSRQRHEFQVHARRYLETYMPDSGVEFALTTRYQRASRLTSAPESSRTAQEQHAAAVVAAEAAAAEAVRAAAATSAVARGKLRLENGEALGTSMADLCVVATKPFKAGELIIMCKGGVKDLTKNEDEALREEASLSRERRKDQQYTGVLGPGRDFSVIRSARKGCSQLLLGPARFVNHDCDPNCEFYRLGQSQMVFKCLRDVDLNEEITTYYGDNYFEVDNAECMCHTCELRGNGAFAKVAPAPEVPAPPSTDTDMTAASTTGKVRRQSSRKGRSPPPAPIKQQPTTLRIERTNGKMTKVIEKTFDHHVSGREFDDDSIVHAGPRCTCLTCGSPFWAPETWWLPDECRRCERHFKIYQGDWPARVPTEPKWSAIYRDRKARRETVESEARRGKLLDTASPGLGVSDTDTPVKLSPLRMTEEEDAKQKGPRASNSSSAGKHPNGKTKRHPSATMPNGSAARKKMRVIPDDEDDDEDDDADEEFHDVDDGGDENWSAGEVEKVNRDRIPFKRRPVAAEEDDLSDLTSVSANENDVLMSRGSSTISTGSSNSGDKSSGPKMLGKQAKTETLAMFWGASEGNKRVRKPRLNGLESLSDTVKLQQHKHRRTASDMSSASLAALRERAENFRSPSGPQLSHVSSAEVLRKAASSSGRRDSNSMATTSPKTMSLDEGAGGGSLVSQSFIPLSTPASQPDLPSSAVSEASDLPLASASAPPSGAIATSPSLATQGPERTSVKNLAMAWGAGIEDSGGRASRRRTPRDVASPSLISSSSPKRAKEEGSATPPTKIRRETASPTRRTSTSEMPREDNTRSASATATTSHVTPSTTGKLVAPLPTPPSMTAAAQSPVAASPLATRPHLAASAVSAYTPSASVSASSPSPSDRSVSPALSASGSSVHAYNGSPLTGPPPLLASSTPSTAFAGRPGVVSGKPIRRNLRWGSGKTSLSRPLIGAGSPLAGPAAGGISSSSPSAPSNTSHGPTAASNGLLPSPIAPSLGATTVLASMSEAEERKTDFEAMHHLRSPPFPPHDDAHADSKMGGLDVTPAPEPEAHPFAQHAAFLRTTSDPAFAYDGKKDTLDRSPREGQLPIMGSMDAANFLDASATPTRPMQNGNSPHAVAIKTEHVPSSSEAS